MVYLKRVTLGVITVVSIFLIAIFAVGGLVTYAYFLPTLESKQTIINNNQTGLTLQDENGEAFFTFYSGRDPKYVNLPEISDSVKKAAIASEDEEFYEHGGFSIKAIVRSVLLNLQEGGFHFGGSTITQQLVKNSLLSPQKNLFRKFQEVVLAVGIENKYSKDEILEMYLNSSYFGEGAFGIEGAADTFFGKKAKDLTLSESSFLVGILSSPSALSPFGGDLDKAKIRQEYVLAKMAENGYITDEDSLGAFSADLAFAENTSKINNLAPHFAVMVKNELVKKFGEETIIRSGFKVKTTLNSEWQRYAEDSVKRNVATLRGNNAHNGAAVVIDPHSGEIKALVGSVDWYDDYFGKVNMVTSERQPGSAFKPIVYGIALENRIVTPATILPDAPSTFRIPDCRVNCNYQPRNYDGRFRGNVTVRRALSNSLNVPSVHLLQRVGVDQVVDYANDIGLDLGSSDRYGLSLVLGAAEVSLLNLTSAYSAFANSGEMVEANYIKEIIDKSGQNIYRDVPKQMTAWGADTSFLISSILSDNRARAEVFGNALTVSRPAAVKTGTTTSYRDAWTIGYTPDLIVGVWVGNNDNKSMDGIAGSLGAAPIWRDLIETFSRGTLARNFEPPENIVRLASCSNGKNGSASNSAGMEFFIAGTEPSRSCIPSNVAGSPSGKFILGVGGGARVPSGTPAPTDVSPPPNPNTPPNLDNPPPNIQNNNSGRGNGDGNAEKKDNSGRGNGDD